MTPEDRTRMHIARMTHYNYIMRTTMFVLLGVVAVVELGDVGRSLPLILITVSVAAYGILAGNVTQDDIMALHEDMDEATAASHYGAGARARHVATLKQASSGAIALIAAAIVVSILV